MCWFLLRYLQRVGWICVCFCALAFMSGFLLRFYRSKHCMWLLLYVGFYAWVFIVWVGFSLHFMRWVFLLGRRGRYIFPRAATVQQMTRVIMKLISGLRESSFNDLSARRGRNHYRKLHDSGGKWPAINSTYTVSNVLGIIVLWYFLCLIRCWLSLETYEKIEQ